MKKDLDRFMKEDQIDALDAHRFVSPNTTVYTDLESLEESRNTKEELLLIGKNEELDTYIKNLKERSRGRGVLNLRRLLNLQRTYPNEPFMAGISKALQYGLYDLARLEKIILNNTAGEYFNLS